MHILDVSMKHMLMDIVYVSKMPIGCSSGSLNRKSQFNQVGHSPNVFSSAQYDFGELSLKKE